MIDLKDLEELSFELSTVSDIITSQRKDVTDVGLGLQLSLTAMSLRAAGNDLLRLKDYISNIKERPNLNTRYSCPRCGYIGSLSAKEPGDDRCNRCDTRVHAALTAYDEANKK